MFKKYYEVYQVPLHLFVFLVSLFYVSPIVIILGFLFAHLVMMLSQEVGGHRYFSHYSFEVTDIVEKLIFLSMIIAGNGSPLDWRSSHLDHHSYCDTDKDPTSPKRFGVFGILSNNWKLKYTPLHTALRSMVWVNKNKPQWIKYHDMYFKLLLAYQVFILLLSILFGFEFFIVFLTLPILVSNIYLNCISAYCHQHRYKNENESHLAVDNKIVNLFSPGAGNHSEHHDMPGMYKSKRVDITGFVIDLVKKKVA